MKALAIGIWLVVLGAGGAPASSPGAKLPRTDPKTWSAAGWESLRWGMGPGDVEQVIAEELKAGGHLEPRQRPRKGARVSHYVLAGSSLTLGGAPAEVQLDFVDGRLVGVGKDAAIAEVERAYRAAAAAREEITRVAGKPTREEHPEVLGSGDPSAERRDAPYHGTWRSGRESEASLLLGVSPVPGVPSRLMFAASDPAEREAARRLAENEEQVHAKESDRELSRGDLVMAVNRYAIYLLLAGEVKAVSFSEDTRAARSELGAACTSMARRGDCSSLERSIRAHPDQYVAWTGEGFPAGR